MKLIILFAFSISFLNAAAARLTDGKIKTTYVAEQIQITPLKGYHLNSEAPASATFDSHEAIYKPIKKSEQLFTFKPTVGAKVASLNFYVCDDKKTACEQHQTKLELINSKMTKAESATGVIPAAAAPKPFSGNKIAPLANAEGKPTLLAFSAPWCPACIRMQTETYPNKAVSKALSQVTLKKVNSDLVENFELSEKFHVKAIPTLILLNSQGEEVYRWLDFQTANTFAKSLKAETKKLATDSTSLLAKAQAGDLEAASQLGMREYSSLNCDEAVKWLSLSKKPADQKYKLAAEVSCAQETASENEKTKEIYLKTLEKGIVLSASEFDQMRWFINWLEIKRQAGPLNEDAKAKALNLKKRLSELSLNQRELKNIFFDSTYGEAGGFEKEEILYSIANIEGLLDQTAEQNKTKAQSIALLSKRKLSVDRPGEMLMAISYLREAGETKKVDQMYEALVKKYPATYVYFEKYARYQLKNKNYVEALPLSKKALSYAEGNNPQLMLLMANVLKSMDRKIEAQTTVDNALKLKEIEHPRFKRALAQLKNLKEELSK